MSRRTQRQQQRRQQKNQRYLIAGGLIGLVILIGLAVVLLGQGDEDSTTSTSSLDREISVAEAAEMRSEGAFMLDVREPWEWEEVHIPGATLIPLGELNSRVNELPRDQDIVVVCRSGNRSADGRDILLDAGFSRVTSMAGGMNQWQSAGYAIE